MRIHPALRWSLAALALAVLVAPLFLGPDLGARAAQRRLDRGWQPDYRVIPLLARAHAADAQGRRLSPREAQDLRQELRGFTGAHPEFFWLELAWLQARAGRLDDARADLKTAQGFDGKVIFMTRSRLWDPWRRELQL